MKQLNTKNWLQTYQEFLHTKNLSKNTIKNYQADIKKFLNSTHVQIKLSHPTATPSEIFHPQTFQAYKQQLSKQVKSQNLSLAIAKRRLASLRSFACFLKDTGRTSQNPTQFLGSFSAASHRALEQKFALKQKKYLPRGIAAQIPLGLGTFLSQFKHDLINQKISKVSIKNYLSDSRQFLRWLEAQD